jgi:hypothetical protein
MNLLPHGGDDRSCEGVRMLAEAGGPTNSGGRRPRASKETAMRERMSLSRAPVQAFGPRMVCTGCGIIGADARPNWREKAQ